jgi:hypothetical protein
MTTPRPATLEIDTSSRPYLVAALEAAFILRNKLYHLGQVGLPADVNLESLIDELDAKLDAVSCGQCGSFEADNELTPDDFERAQLWLEKISSYKVETGLRCDDCWKDLTE